MRVAVRTKMASLQSQLFTLLIFSTLSSSLSAFTFTVSSSAAPNRRLLPGFQFQGGFVRANFQAGPTNPSNSADAFNNSPRFIAREFVEAHNQIREKFGEPPMRWDRGLARVARRWASERVNDCKMIHSPDNTYGENLFWGGDDHWTPGDVVKEWASENQYYNGGNNQCETGQQCGHYTQIVWYNSVRLGCARQKCANGGLIVVCNYDPPGNFLDQGPFQKNQ